MAHSLEGLRSAFLNAPSGVTSTPTRSKPCLPDVPWSFRGADLLLQVRLTPNGSRDEIRGIAILAGGRCVLQARVRAAPEKGCANEALLRLVAKILRIPHRAIRLQAGASGRTKTLCLKDARGLVAELERLWPKP